MGGRGMQFLAKGAPLVLFVLAGHLGIASVLHVRIRACPCPPPLPPPALPPEQGAGSAQPHETHKNMFVRRCRGG